MEAEASKLFESNLRTLYKKIDIISSTMWGQSSLMETKLRSADSRENDNWKKETKAQIGYGEITKGHMTQILSLMQHITDLVPPEYREALINPAESYNISEKSRFLDIGSGFGKPVFHAAMQIGCESKGIEVVPARVEFSLDFLLSIVENKGKWTLKEKNSTAKEKMTESGDEDQNGKKRKNPESAVMNEISRKYKIISKEKSKKILPKGWSVVPWHNLVDGKSSNAVGVVVPQYDQKIVTSQKVDDKARRKHRQNGKHELSLNFKPDWYEKVKFERIDATKIKFYGNEQGEHYTHIYSYNKVMTKEAISDICGILNNTDYRVLAWYFNENETKKCGLKDFILVHKMPMLSTGNEKFTVYVYVKVKPGTKTNGSSNCR